MNDSLNSNCPAGFIFAPAKPTINVDYIRPSGRVRAYWDKYYLKGDGADTNSD